VRFEHEERFWMGPLPSPDTFEAYERVLPGISDLIVRNWNDESGHRRARERTSDDRKFALASRGQIMAFGLGAGGLGLIGYSLFLDRPLESALLWAVAALIAAMAGRAAWPLFAGGRTDRTSRPPAPERPPATNR